MATFEVTREIITVLPHPNADALECARVGLYDVIVDKGRFQTGDEVFYIPEFAIVPERIITFMNLEGKLAGSKKNRIKPIRLRGVVSQGLVIPLSLLETEVEEGVTDYSEALGITKWEPVVPAALAGNVKAIPEMVRWSDIESIKKYPNMFSEGEEVVITEKVHGTCTCITVVNPGTEDAVSHVASKGVAAKYLALERNVRNVYWRMFDKHNLEGFAAHVAANIDGEVRKVAIFGETYGSVQDLSYGLPGDLGYVLFDLHVTYVDDTTQWLPSDVVQQLADEFGIPTAPVLYVGAYSLEKVQELAYGPELVSGTEAHIREGVIVRGADTNVSAYRQRRQIGKFVSDDYLTRKGGTEYS